MAVAKHFVFWQRDLQNASFTAFYDMKNNGQLSDVTVRIADRPITAHRIILAAAIPYFQTIFASNFAESKEREIRIQNLDPDALESLINFAYTGKVRITLENVQVLMLASEFLQLTKVRDSCCDFLSKTLDATNVMQIRAFAAGLSCRNMIESCDSYIRNHFNDFWHVNEFLELPFPVLVEVLRSDNLKVRNEEKVFEAVMRWVKSDEKRHSSLPDLLKCVRMTYLSSQFLVNKASSEELIMSSFPCRDLLDEAKHYHLLLEEERSSVCSFTLTPRYYEPSIGMLLVLQCSESSGLTIFKYDSNANSWSILLVDRKRGDLRQAVALSCHVYVLRSNNVFESFDPFTLQWTTLQNCPLTSSSLKYLVPYDSRIYCSEGGHYFDIKQKRWFAENYSHPGFQYAETALSCRGNIYLFHSLLFGTTAINNIQRNTTTQIKQIQCFRRNFGCMSLEGNVYVCGGVSVSNTPSSGFAFGAPHSQNSTPLLKSTQVYSPADGTWTVISPMTIARQNFSLAAYNKKLYAIGGTTLNGQYINNVECYDPATDKWSSAGTLDGQHCNFVKAVSTSSKQD